MFRSLILATATIGALAIGTAAPAQAFYHCGNPYIGGVECQDQRIGLGAMLYHAIGPGGIFNPRILGGGYGYRPYGYRPYGYRPYRRPMAWCVGRDPWGRIVSRTPGPCRNGY